MKEVIILIIQIGLLLLAFLASKGIINVHTSSESIGDIINKTNLMLTWAEQFVSYARYFLSALTGKEKMDKVVEYLENIAQRNKIDMTTDEIRAIAQKAYDAMKVLEEKAENEKIKTEAVVKTAEVQQQTIAQTVTTPVVDTPTAEVIKPEEEHTNTTSEPVVLLEQT